MERERAVLQLRLIRAVLRQELDSDRPTIAFAIRASALIERTAISIEPEPDHELRRLLGDARDDVLTLAERAVE